MHSREALLIQKSKEAQKPSEWVAKWLLWVLARVVTPDEWEKSITEGKSPNEVWKGRS